jgi:hypothetical protein
MNAVFRHDAAMKILLFSAFALVLAAPAFAGDMTPRPPSEAQPETQTQIQPKQTPVRDMDRILQELRDLDSSQEMDGDHVVGKHLC